MKKLKLETVKMSNIEINFKELYKVKEQLRAIMHPLRFSIVKYIDQNPDTNVTDIWQKFKIEQAVASQMLGILKKNSLVKCRQSGKEMRYQVCQEELKKLNDRCLYDF